MRHVLLATATAVLVAIPVAAQQPAARDTARHRMMGGHMAGQGMAGRGSARAGAMGCSMMAGGMTPDSAMGGMMEGMMREMALSPEHLLARTSALALTADQEQRLTVIRDAARAAHDAAMRTAMHHLQELADVMRAPAPDTTAVERHFDGAHAAMGQAHLAMLRSAALARAVLTDAQRRQSDSLATAMGCGAMGAAPAAGQPAHRH
jgi:Spy/CpxP family protein refolding chaperone